MLNIMFQKKKKLIEGGKLKIKLRNDKEEIKTVWRLTYMTQGITWQTNYTLERLQEKRATFSAYVTITNETKTSFPNSTIILTEVPPTEENYSGERFYSYSSMKRPKTKMLDKYKEYSHELLSGINIPTKLTTISYINPRDLSYHKANIAFFNAPPNAGVPPIPYVKNSEFFNFPDAQVNTYYRIENSVENNLGYIFPKGNVQLFGFKPINFSSNQIKHTEGSEIFLHQMKKDIMVKRSRIDFNHHDNNIIETLGYSIENNEDKPSKIQIRQHIYRSRNWNVISTDHVKETNVIESYLVLNIIIASKAQLEVQCTIGYTL